MPQPPQPSQQPSAAGPIGAAAAPYVAAAVAPAVASRAAVAGLGAGTALTVGGLIEALQRFAAMRFASAEPFVEQEVARAHPQMSLGDIRAIVEQEREFEAEFRRKMQQRLQRDLPKAFAISDPVQRLDAIKAIFQREQQFTVMREEAMLLRALGKAEAFLLRALSPQGAYWKLSPHVKEHTLDCLAMGEKFWPWTVLAKFQPPVHHGCQCYLLGLDEAVAAGYMHPDQVPNPVEAEKRAKKLLRDAHTAMNEVPENDLRRWMEEAVAVWQGVESGSNVVSLDEARGTRERERLRFAKGLVRGGQFMPQRGGWSDAVRRSMHDMLRIESPATGRQHKRGDWKWINGRQVKVPRDSSWEHRAGGVKYTSPPGTTEVYRDGVALDAPERGRLSPGTLERRSPGAAYDRLRGNTRDAHAEDMRRRVAAKHSPLTDGDPASRLLALPDAGFRLHGIEPASRGQRLHYKAAGGATVSATFDGKGVRDVAWNAAPDVAMPRAELARAPADFHAFAGDVLSWADELGDRFGSEVHVPEVRIDRRLSDHAGQHQWTGEADLGADTARDIERAGAARAAGRALTDDQARGVWASYWVAAHEALGHGVNPISANLYVGAHANLEEALAEEASHLLAVERLEKQGQHDVLDWRQRHQDHLAVRGNYLFQRGSLGRLLDEAGITDPEARQDAVMDLAFRTPPAQRFDQLASLLHAAHPEHSLDDLKGHAELMMLQLGEERPALAPVWRMPEKGVSGYAAYRDAWMSQDGRALYTPGGDMVRVEHIDGAPEGSDGSAIVHYAAGQRATDGPLHEDGSPKSFSFLDTLDRALLVLRAFLGKGSPGDSGRDDQDDAEQRLARLSPGGWEWAAGSPVHRAFDGSYSVDGEKATTPKEAARVAFARATGAKASPGVLTNKALADALDGLADEQSGVSMRVKDVSDKVSGEYVLGGKVVGNWQRAVKGDGVGINWDQLDADLRGQGIAARLAARQEDALAGLGVKRLLADPITPLGGKYLARQGFTELDKPIPGATFAKTVSTKASPGWKGIKKKLSKAQEEFLATMGTSGLPEGDAQIVQDAIAASTSSKPVKPKGPPDTLVGKKIGGGDTLGVPSDSPIPDYSSTPLTIGKGAGGTQGARWAFGEDGGRWLVKSYKGDRDRVATELLGNAVYRAVGVKAAEAGTTLMPRTDKDWSQVPDRDIGEPPLPDTKKRVSTGVIVMEPDGRIWMVEPRDHYGGYEHTFPKGGLEGGLSPQQNAHKELWEESGLRGEIVGHVGDFEGDTSLTRYYVARRTGGEPTVSAETEAVKLVHPADAEAMLNRDRDKAVLAAFEQLGGLPEGSGQDVNPPTLPPTLALTYPTLEGEVHQHFKPSEKVGAGYMTDALIGNWDFVGATGDNILWGPDGEPIRLDQGGTFELRAMGGNKPFGPVPTEVWTMLAKGQGKRGVIVTEDQMRDQAANIGHSLPDSKVDQLVDAAPFLDSAMKERVRENLKARVQWMRDFATGKVDLPRPAEGDAARDLLDGMDVRPFPEQEDALAGYMEGLHTTISGLLRDKDKKVSDASKPVKRAIKELDGLLRYSKTPGDLIAYVGVGGDPGNAAKLDGKVLRERAYMHANLDEPDSPVMLRLTVPEGSLALYTQAVPGMPAEPELLLARGAEVKIARVEQRADGKAVLHATVVTKPSYDTGGGGWKGDWKGGGGYGGGGGGGGDKPDPKWGYPVGGKGKGKSSQKGLW